MQNSVAKKFFAVGSAALMTLSLAVPFVASAAPHSVGTNVSTPDGTVWMITGSNTRRAYTSAGAFLSYGFNSWANVMPASADDLALPVDSAGFIPPQDGTVFCATASKGTDVKGECSLVTGGMKAAFTSAAVFTGQGFSFSRAQYGDSSFLNKGSNISDASSAHRPGVLINNNGTVQLVGNTGLLGVPDLATFNSWGYSFANVVPANAADKAMSQTGVMAMRMAGQLSPTAMSNPNPTPNPSPSPVPGNGGGLSVSLSSATPAATNVAAGAAFLSATAINFTASGNPVVVTGLVVRRSGLGADSNLNNVYLFNGNTMLAQTSSIQNGAISFSMPTGLFTVPANSTLTIMVKFDLATGVSSGLTYAFGLNSASDVVSNASAVSGTFPIVGNLVTSASVSSPALATLTVTNSAVGSSINAGTTGFLAGQFNLSSANSSVKITGINLTFIGSANVTTDLKNLKVMAGGTQYGATVTNLSGQATFVDMSASPLMIPTGNTVNVQVFVDVVGGVNRNMQFSIQRNYDIIGYDTTYNVGILSASSFPVNATQVTINAGTLTVTRDTSSRTNQVAPGQTNVQLATFAFQANGEGMKILNLPFQITGDGTNNQLKINNVKLVDNSGFGLGTSDTSQRTICSSGCVTGSITSYTNGPSGGSPTFTQSSNFNYVVQANTTAKISIVSDIVSGTAQSSITGSLTAGSSNAQGVTSVNSVSTPAVSGNTLTISSTLLSAVLNSGLANPIKIVPNAMATKVASFTLNAGGADSVSVTTVTVTTNTTSVAANFQNLKVMIGSTQLGQTQTTLANNSAYSFSPSSAVTIPAGGSVNVDVYVDVLSGAETSFNNNIVTLTSVTSQLTTSGSSITSPGSVNGQTVLVTGNGAVTVSQSPTTPVSRQLAMNQTGQILGVIKFAETTGNEAATLTDLTITATGVAGTTLNGSTSNSVNTLLNFTITATDNTGATLGSTFTKGSWSSGTGGAGTQTYTVTFNNINLPIPQGPAKYMNLTVKADLNSFTNGAASNSQWTVGLATASAATIRGQASNATITPTLTSNAASNTTTVVRTTIGVSAIGSISSPVSVVVQPTGVPGTTENMAIFAVTANTAGDAVLRSVTLQQGGTAPTSVGVVYSVFDASNGLSTSVGFVTLTGTAANGATLNGGSAAAAGGVTVSAGTTKYLVVQANTSNFNTGSSGTTKSYSLTATTWTFSDGTANVGQSGDASAVPAVTSTGAPRTY